MKLEETIGRLFRVLVSAPEIKGETFESDKFDDFHEFVKTFSPTNKTIYDELTVVFNGGKEKMLKYGGTVYTFPNGPTSVHIPGQFCDEYKSKFSLKSTMEQIAEIVMRESQVPVKIRYCIRNFKDPGEYPIIEVPFSAVKETIETGKIPELAEVRVIGTYVLSNPSGR